LNAAKANRQQLDNINEIVETIHKKVQRMEESRQNVKETLVVLDRDHPRFKEVDFTLTYNPVQLPSAAPSVPLSSPRAVELNRRLLDELEEMAWTPRVIRCETRTRTRPTCHSLSKRNIKIILVKGKTACIEIQISEAEQDILKRVGNDFKDRVARNLRSAEGLSGDAKGQVTGICPCIQQ
jgi:hypothetical protein